MSETEQTRERASRSAQRERYGSLDTRAGWLADILRRRVWTYIPGSRLPGERELAKRFRVSLRVARRATELLEEEGLIASRRGKGSVVVREQSSPIPVRRIVAIIAAEKAATASEMQGILLGAHEAAGRRGRSFEVIRAERIDLNRSDCLQTAVRGSAGCLDIGWMFVRVAPPAPVLEAWRLARLPIVLIDHDPSAGAHTVNTDARSSTMLATERALLLGHRRIAFVGNTGADADCAAAARWQGFQLAMQRYHQRINEHYLCRIDDEPHRDVQAALARVLTSTVRPTAVIAANQSLGCEVLIAADMLGLAVGEQLTVIAGGLERQGLPNGHIQRLSRVSEGRPEKIGQLASSLMLESHVSETPVKLFSDCEWIDCGSAKPNLEPATRGMSPASADATVGRAPSPRHNSPGES